MMQTDPRYHAICFVIVASAVVGQCSLTTTFGYTNGQAGNMFDVVTLNPAGVEITQLTVHVDSGPITIEVFALNGVGTYWGNQNIPPHWNLIETFNVTGNGQGLPTVLPPFTLGGGPHGGISISPGGIQGLYVTIATGQVMWYTTGTLQGAVFASNADLELHEGSGVVYPFSTTFTPRVWNGILNYTYPGQVMEWETNTQTASLDIDQVVASSCGPALINRTIPVCPVLAAVPGTLTVSAQGNPGALFEIFANLSPLVPATTGGLALPQNGEIVNLDLGGGLSFFNGNSSPLLLPVPSTVLSLPFAVAAPVDVSLQGLITNAAFPAGFELTQAVEYHAALGPVAAVPGPMGNDEVVTYDLTSFPTCWLTSGYEMYGTTYSQLHLDSNGRWMALLDTSDFTPTIAEALSGPPHVGIWNDFNPSLPAGEITVANPNPGVIRATWTNVPYGGLSASSSTWAIEYDDATKIISLDGLATGLWPTTQASTWLGITPGALGIPGSPATDPGAVIFAAGGSSVPGSGTDMLYDFSLAPALPGSINGTLNRIDFLPTLVGGNATYLWTGS